MMNRILLIAVIMTILVSCKTKDKKSELIGKWQAISLENPQLDKLMEEQIKFLDTFGKNNKNAQNIEIYGFSNIDSAREVLQKEMVEYKAMQDHAVKNTWFDFRKDGKIIMNFSGQVDSSEWKIDDAGALVVDNGADSTDNIKLEILYLSDSVLKLQMNDRGMSSTVVFKPAGK